MKATVNIIKDLVDFISATVIITNATDNLDGTFTLESENTYWLSKDDTITIDSETYIVTAFQQNIDFTIIATGNGGLPTVSSFELQQPTYIHGTLRMAKNEVNAIKNKMDLVPFVYLYEVIRDKKNTDEASAIDRETILRIFFLNSSSFKDMLTEDVYEYIINPMQTIVDEFLNKVKNSRYFTENMDYETIPLVNFSDEGEQQKSIFDINLSGIELRLSAEIRKDLSCTDYIVPTPPSCEDAELIINETESITIPSGDTFPFTVTLDGTPSGTYNDATDTWEVISNPICADATVNVNGNLFDTVASGSPINVPVEYENGTPVGTIVSGVVEIPNPVAPSGIAYNFPMLTGQTAIYRTGDDGWHYAAGTYNRTNPTNPIHVVKLVNFKTLENNNIFGNTDRFTDNLGTQIYAAGVFIDHYTKLMWTTVRGFDTFDNSIDLANAYVDSLGNDDYRLSNDEEKNSIYNVENNGFNYAPLNTFWAYSGSNYHTSTTNKLTTTENLKANREDKSIASLKSLGAYSLRVRNWEG